MMHLAAGLILLVDNSSGQSYKSPENIISGVPSGLAQNEAGTIVTLAANMVPYRKHQQVNI